jgi:hypothetical protein
MHHAFIDKKENVPAYPVTRLRHFKKIHEARMRYMTSLPSTAKTHAVRFIGQVRAHLTTVSDTEIFETIFATENRYTDADVFDIDLEAFLDTADDAYWNTCKVKIDAMVRQRILPLIENGSIERLSILAIARIPLLAYFGRQLGDKVPTELYQKHRTNGEGWTWPAAGHEVRFEIVPHGDVASSDVALLASVSGGDLAKVRRATKAGLIYEIRPVGESPSRTLLDSPATLQNFRKTYHDFMSMIEAKHSSVSRIDYFLAVPAPIAIVCGRDLQSDVFPTVVLHDLVDDEYRVAFTLR